VSWRYQLSSCSKDGLKVIAKHEDNVEHWNQMQWVILCACSVGYEQVLEEEGDDEEERIEDEDDQLEE
jgi:hypothetical protein